MSGGLEEMNKEELTCHSCGELRADRHRPPLDPSVLWCFGNCTPLAKASAELEAQGKPLVADVRTFPSGATRDTDEGKHDIEAFFSPLVTKRRAEYMHLHRKLGDGNMREGDNWQLGMPYNECLKSLCRHVEDIKLLSRGYDAREDIETALCAVMFNCESMLLTRLEEKT